MSSPHAQSATSPEFPFLPTFRGQLRDGLALLLQAYICARDAHANPWDFGVEIANMREVGVSDTVLRWLSLKGAIQHRMELTNSDASERSFGSASRLKFTSGSVLVLTEDGYSLAAQLDLLDSVNLPTPQLCIPVANERIAEDAEWPSVWRAEHQPPAEHDGEICLPFWDAMRKELWFQDRLVKRFRLPSPNQETILMAFQEDCWPARIDDPLPPPSQPNQHVQRRLRNTIKALNRRQINRLITFRADGPGEGVLWNSYSP